jgi:ribosomal protein L6P/L9E
MPFIILILVYPYRKICKLADSCLLNMRNFCCFVFPSFLKILCLNKTLVVKYCQKKIFIPLVNKIFFYKSRFFFRTTFIQMLMYNKLLYNSILDLVNHNILYLKVVGLNQHIYLKQNSLYLNVGFSHHVKYFIPKNLFFYLYDMQSSFFSISSFSRSFLGSVFKHICSLYPYNVYQGHGIFLLNSLITQKKIRKK